MSTRLARREDRSAGAAVCVLIKGTYEVTCRAAAWTTQPRLTKAPTRLLKGRPAALPRAGGNSTKGSRRPLSVASAASWRGCADNRGEARQCS